jgi:hypothetical protein
MKYKKYLSHNCPAEPDTRSTSSKWFSNILECHWSLRVTIRVWMSTRELEMVFWDSLSKLSVGVTTSIWVSIPEMLREIRLWVFRISICFSIFASPRFSLWHSFSCQRTRDMLDAPAEFSSTDRFSQKESWQRSSCHCGGHLPLKPSIFGLCLSLRSEGKLRIFKKPDVCAVSSPVPIKRLLISSDQLLNWRNVVIQMSDLLFRPSLIWSQRFPSPN